MKVISKTIHRSLALLPDTSLDKESSRLHNVCEKLVTDAIDCLDEKEKHFVILHGWFNCSFYEVAVTEHMSPCGARMKYARLVKKLKMMIMSRFIFEGHIYKQQLLWELS